MKNLSDPDIRRSLAGRLSKLRFDSPRQWGRMTPHQMVCHLSDSFLVCLGGKAVSPVTGPMRWRIMRWMALYSPMPWPKGLPTRPEVDQNVGGTPPVDFEVDRRALVELMERFTFSKSRTPHPMFGNMSDHDWHRWGYLHMDHHLRQFGV